MATFSERHYEKLAQSYHRQLTASLDHFQTYSTLRESVEWIAAMLAVDNPRFNKEKFFAAAIPPLPPQSILK